VSPGEARGVRVVREEADWRGRLWVLGCNEGVAAMAEEREMRALRATAGNAGNDGAWLPAGA